MSTGERTSAAASSACTPPRPGETPESATELPPSVEKGKDDGLLESLGKAITAPVEGAAEPEEPPNDGRRSPTPPG